MKGLYRVGVSLFVLLLGVSEVRSEQVVFSEIMYHPAGTLPEYIEVCNNTATVFDIAQWRTSDGVEYVFPAFSSVTPDQTFLKPFERILLSGVDEATLRASYAVPTTTRVFGPWTGNLKNSGERITLCDKNGVLVCTVEYNDRNQWSPAADGAGHHLHRAGGIVAPAADLDPGKAGIAGGKQCGMPTEQTLPRYRCLAVGRGIQHHLDHALNVPIDRGQGADVHAQPARDGRAHGFDVELLALDLAGLDHVLGERREARLIAQRHADVGQAPHQESLGTTDLGHGPGQSSQVEAPVRPVASLPDVVVIAAIHAEIMRHNLRIRKSFTA